MEPEGKAALVLTVTHNVGTHYDDETTRAKVLGVVDNMDDARELIARHAITVDANNPFVFRVSPGTYELHPTTIYATGEFAKGDR